MKTYSEQEILDILHSIDFLSGEDDEPLDVRFKGESAMSGISEFIPGSFTRELLSTIEYHMSGADGSAYKYSGQEVLDLLNSIDALSVREGELGVHIKGNIDGRTGRVPEVSGIDEFIPGSLTSELLGVIEHHMLLEERVV